MNTASLYYIIFGLLVVSVILFLLWRRSVRLLKKSKFTNTSLSTRYGKMTEQFMPFLAHYPYDPGRFRFLGTPIDGVQFNDDEVVLIEFKTASSQLSATQRTVRDLVKYGKVRFEEIRI